MAFANAHNIEAVGYTLRLGCLSVNVHGQRLPNPIEGFALHIIPGLRLKVAWYKSDRWIWSVELQGTFLCWRGFLSLFKQ
jgi:hypothetical protein